MILEPRASRLAFVALGSNLGDSRGIILQAMDRLQDFSNEPLRRSSLWQTAPMDCPPGSPMFVNAVVGLAPLAYETPASLLAKLHGIEVAFGRQARGAKNEPRLLDLDLIAFGSETCATPELIVPHPRAHQRWFVLQPLSEIAPEFVLPGQSQTVGDLLAALDLGEKVRRNVQIASRLKH